jgi:hypothetical protein
MLKRLALIGVTAAASALTFVACGDEGPGSISCTTDTDCQLGEICHPNAGVCVRTCSTSTDCPTEAKTCKTTPATGSQMICTCATDQLCEQELGAGTVCSDRWEVCVGSEDTTCNPSSTTLGSAGGPDTCSYGDFCSGSTCAAAPVGTCGEATGAGAPVWNQTAKAAPVITSATAVVKNVTTSNECQLNEPAGIVTIRYYAPNGLTTHSEFADLQNHVKFRNATSGQFFGANFPVQNPTPGATFGEFQVGIGCGNATETAAVYIADESGRTSNVVCVSW